MAIPAALDDRLYAAMIHATAVVGAGTVFESPTLWCREYGSRCEMPVRWYELQNLTTTPTLVQSGRRCSTGPPLPAPLRLGNINIPVASPAEPHRWSGFTSSVLIRQQPAALGGLAIRRHDDWTAVAAYLQYHHISLASHDPGGASRSAHGTTRVRSIHGAAHGPWHGRSGETARRWTVTPFASTSRRRRPPARFASHWTTAMS